MKKRTVRRDATLFIIFKYSVQNFIFSLSLLNFILPSLQDNYFNKIYLFRRAVQEASSLSSAPFTY